MTQYSQIVSLAWAAYGNTVQRYLQTLERDTADPLDDAELQRRRELFLAEALKEFVRYLPATVRKEFARHPKPPAGSFNNPAPAAAHNQQQHKIA